MLDFSLDGSVVSYLMVHGGPEGKGTMQNGRTLEQRLADYLAAEDAYRVELVSKLTGEGAR